MPCQILLFIQIWKKWLLVLEVSMHIHTRFLSCVGFQNIGQGQQKQTIIMSDIWGLFIKVNRITIYIQVLRINTQNPTLPYIPPYLGENRIFVEGSLPNSDLRQRCRGAAVFSLFGDVVLIKRHNYQNPEYLYVYCNSVYFYK